MEKLHFQLCIFVLIAVQQISSKPVSAEPRITAKPSNAKLQPSANQEKKPSKEAEKPNYPKTDDQFIARAVRTHVPAPGQFIKRRQRIWETLKRNYTQKKDISQVLREYVKMNDSVVRGTNWVMDDAGNYTRMRPLSHQCKELEDSLGLSWQSAEK